MLRALVENRTLPLNRPGAAGWRIADDLWLVADRVAEGLRDHWRLRDWKPMPPDELPLLQVLLDAGVLIPNLDGGPTWRRDITPVGHAVHFFTLVRIPVHLLWSDPASSSGCFEEAPLEQGPQMEDHP